MINVVKNTTKDVIYKDLVEVALSKSSSYSALINGVFEANIHPNTNYFYSLIIESGIIY